MFAQKSREYVITISSTLLAIGATVSIKALVMMYLRGSFFSGYYRKSPTAANFTNVIVECWSLGLSIGTVATRLAQLLVVTAFYVGRIDTPMLAPGVGNIMGFSLDPAPDAFKTDLLIHEAVSQTVFAENEDDNQMSSYDFTDWNESISTATPISNDWVFCIS
jgi:hypothetical protein